jgi:hypothetical protein
LNPVSRNLGLWLLLLLMGLLLWSIVTKQQPREPPISFSRFVQAVEEDRVAEVTIQGQHIRGRYKADKGAMGDGFKTYAPEDPDLVRMLREKGVEIDAQPEDAEPWYLVAIVQWAPMLLLIGVWIFFMRQMQLGGGKAMSFGKSRAKLLSENQHKVTFNDVAGIDEAKEELEEIIAFLKDPKKFTKLGGRIPKGVLLVGAPGTARRCSPGPSPARRACPSSRSRARTSSRCSSASGPPASATSSSRGRRMPPASSSSTRSTPSAGTGARASAVATTSASRRSTSCSSRWTASRPTRA